MPNNRLALPLQEILDPPLLKRKHIVLQKDESEMRGPESSLIT